MRFSDLGTLARAVVRSAASLITSSTLPETCAGCGVVGAWFCPDCLPLLKIDGPVGCQRCGRRGIVRPDCSHCRAHFPVTLYRLRAGYAYDGPMRHAVQRFKYSREYERGRDLGRLLAARYEALWPALRVDAIVPVPLHPRRYRERGFNQSQVLAEALSGVVGAPVIQAVVRSRHTTPQVRLTSTERISNLRDAFTVEDSSGELIHGSRVLIVDDVTTTGATIAAVASALQRTEVKEVRAFTLARER